MTTTPHVTVEDVVAEFEPVGLTQWDAHDQCYNESYRFMLCFEGTGIDARLVSGYKFEEFEGNPVIVQGHVGVLVGEVVYDWTARQFDPDAPVPKIYPASKWREDWPPMFP